MCPQKGKYFLQKFHFRKIFSGAKVLYINSLHSNSFPVIEKYLKPLDRFIYFMPPNAIMFKMISFKLQIKESGQGPGSL